ncbi:hypothetical protein V6N11_080720 [Hibiscus sabdariffa]|uniref:Uncharacterized protein n=1 Tax=Hibiscus sabdariffa TaxID=183260 RepID=A0ABR2QI88_9ROSI
MESFMAPCNDCKWGLAIQLALDMIQSKGIMLLMDSHLEGKISMEEACSRLDLTAIHQILVMNRYYDDEGTNEEIIFHRFQNLGLPVFLLDAALADTLQAQIVNPEWPAAFYM